ncbi:MAG: copper amine oxidase N-terminal domain-containing protein [Defluviitaleaceae bacterium]|nr:copper amine oxidase N-terminal domain-containing protein [Defluviitaleaceae bacterium]
MKRKTIVAIMMAAVMALSPILALAQDDYTPEGATEVTALFNLVDPDGPGDEFAMQSEDGELVINITNDTPVYFEDYVPLSEDCEDCEELTKNAREVLFGRTLAEVLDNRNLRVVFEDSYHIEPISITILFESIVTLPETINGDLDLGDYDEVVYDYGHDYDLESNDPLILNGELVVNGEIIVNAPAPFVTDNNIVMVPLRVVAEALGYDVTWNGYLRSVQLGVGIHLWIGGYEVHIGRMAPIEISAAPVLVNNLTFVPLDFFRNILNQTAYAFEGQVVIETYSDMA